MSDNPILNMSLEDLLKKVKEAGKDIKDKAVAEGEELKKLWYKHLLETIDALNTRVDLLEQRVKELENHECKCGKDKVETIRPVS